MTVLSYFAAIAVALFSVVPSTHWLPTTTYRTAPCKLPLSNLDVAVTAAELKPVRWRFASSVYPAVLLTQISYSVRAAIRFRVWLRFSSRSHSRPAAASIAFRTAGAFAQRRQVTPCSALLSSSAAESLTLSLTDWTQNPSKPWPFRLFLPASCRSFDHARPIFPVSARLRAGFGRSAIWVVDPAVVSLFEANPHAATCLVAPE